VGQIEHVRDTFVQNFVRKHEGKSFGNRDMNVKIILKWIVKV
jgi:hypothetical protein